MNTDETIISMLNAFETGKAETVYDTIYLWNDGPGKIKQVTLSRGYTQFGGNLKKVIDRYVSKGGKYSDDLVPYSKKMNDKSLYKDKTFLSVLVKASREDQLMKDAQDEIFGEAYLLAGKKWFVTNGFKLPLSLAVIQDSFLHSGSILGFLRNKFTTNTPSRGGNEKEWIKNYVKARKAWLLSKGGLLANTVYRMSFFEQQFKKDNWDFECPLVANGINLCK